jgi:transcriptional regulator with XRE-family HTH domain
MENLENLDQRIREGFRRVLKELDWTMKDLSANTRVPYRSLQNYLTGDTRMPASVFLELCEALRVDAHYLLEGSMDAEKWPLFDALWESFGDFLPKLKEMPDKISLDDMVKHNKKRAKAEYFAEKIAKHYGHYRRVDFMLLKSLGENAAASEGIPKKVPSRY